MMIIIKVLSAIATAVKSTLFLSGGIIVCSAIIDTLSYLSRNVYRLFK